MWVVKVLRWAVVGLLALLQVGSSLSVIPAPYGQESAFTYHLDKRSAVPILAVFCYQDSQLSFLGEWSLSRRVIDATVTGIISRERSQSVPHPLDETRPTSCLSVVFTERHGNQLPKAITPWVQFDVRP